MDKETIIKRPPIKKVHSKVKREIMMQIKEELFITMIEKIQEKLRLLKIHQKKPKFLLSLKQKLRSTILFLSQVPSILDQQYLSKIFKKDRSF
jgi:ribosomal protein S8